MFAVVYDEVTGHATPCQDANRFPQRMLTLLRAVNIICNASKLKVGAQHKNFIPSFWDSAADLSSKSSARRHFLNLHLTLPQNTLIYAWLSEIHPSPRADEKASKTGNSEVHSKLGADHLGPHFSAERLGALNGHAQRAVDDDLGKDSDGTRNSKEDGVVAGFGQSVVLQ